MIRFKKFKKAIIYVVLMVLAIMTVGYSIRNKVLNQLLEARIDSIENRTGISIHYGKANFYGFNGIEIHQLNINPPEGGTLLRVNRIRVRFNPIALLAMRLNFGYTEVVRPELTLWRQGTESNYLFLLEQKVNDSTPENSDTANVNYKSRIDQMFRLIFKHIPNTIQIKELKVIASINHHLVAIRMEELNIDDQKFESIALISEDSLNDKWKVGGIIQPATGAVGIRISRLGSHLVQIPYIRYRWGLLLAFDSLNINFHYKNTGGEESQINGNIHTQGQIINHARISPDDVHLESGSADFRLNFRESDVEIDSSTRVTYNGQSFHFFCTL